jgi:hypothetical protein
MSRRRVPVELELLVRGHRTNRTSLLPSRSRCAAPSRASPLRRTRLGAQGLRLGSAGRMARERLRPSRRCAAKALKPRRRRTIPLWWRDGNTNFVHLSTGGHIYRWIYRSSHRSTRPSIWNRRPLSPFPAVRADTSNARERPSVISPSDRWSFGEYLRGPRPSERCAAVR